MYIFFLTKRLKNIHEKFEEKQPKCFDMNLCKLGGRGGLKPPKFQILLKVGPKIIVELQNVCKQSSIAIFF